MMLLFYYESIQVTKTIMKRTAIVVKILLLACIFSNTKCIYYQIGSTTEPNVWNIISDESRMTSTTSSPKTSITTQMNYYNNNNVQHLIDMESIPACSRSKCFFRSSSKKKKNKNKNTHNNNDNDDNDNDDDNDDDNDNDNDNDEGYLIARNKYHPNIYNEMKQSWEYVKQLEQKYNNNNNDNDNNNNMNSMIKHFYLEPPQILHLNQSTIIELNKMIYTRTKNINEIDYYFGGGRNRNKNEIYHDHDHDHDHDNDNELVVIVIQKVRKAPDHYIVLHCNEPGRYYSDKSGMKLNDIVSTIRTLRSNEQKQKQKQKQKQIIIPTTTTSAPAIITTPVSAPIITTTTTTTATATATATTTATATAKMTTKTQYFNETFFNKQMNDLQYIMKYENKLWKDFQILIDTRGQIYHIDIDRVYQNSFWYTIQEQLYKYKYKSTKSTSITTSSPTGNNNCIKFINETSTKIINTAATLPIMVDEPNNLREGY